MSYAKIFLYMEFQVQQLVSVVTHDPIFIDFGYMCKKDFGLLLLRETNRGNWPIEKHVSFHSRNKQLPVAKNYGVMLDNTKHTQKRVL